MSVAVSGGWRSASPVTSQTGSGGSKAIHNNKTPKQLCLRKLRYAIWYYKNAFARPNLEPFLNS
jgi:hypothetical protein